jgi:multiple sugar transport system permease protein
MTALEATRGRVGEPGNGLSLLAIRSRTASFLKYASLVAGVLVALVPITVILLTSLKSERETLTTGPLTPPKNWLNYHNYVVAFNEGKMLQGLENTGFIMVFSIFGTLLIGSMTAYAIDRFTFRFRRVVVALFLLATLVPAVTTQVATFQVVTGLGLFNTRWAPIALYTGTDIVSIYIFVQFMRTIPVSLDESARLDGANPWTIYWRIILPNLKPAIATVVIIKGITVYNDFYIPYLYLQDDNLQTVSTSLQRFKGPYGAHWQDISAGAILVIIPTLIIFLLLQRFIYNGFTSGSVK